MVSFEYALKDKLGLHARPAALLVKQVKQYSNVSIFIEYKGSKVDASRMISVMRLGTKQGDTVTFIVDGEKEEEIASKLKEFLKENV